MRRRRSRYRKKERGDAHAHPLGGDRGSERESESRLPSPPLFHPLATHWRRGGTARRAAAAKREGGKGACQLGLRRATSRATLEFSLTLSRRDSRATLNPPSRERRTRTESAENSGALDLSLFHYLASVCRRGRRIVPDVAVIIIALSGAVFLRDLGRGARHRRPSRTRDRANESGRFPLVDIDEVVLWWLENASSFAMSRRRADVAPR